MTPEIKSAKNPLRLIVATSAFNMNGMNPTAVIFSAFLPERKSTNVVRIPVTISYYWDRIGTILVSGEEIERVDTGSGRLVLIEAQIDMFLEYPMGCGHRCTAVLSPNYLADVFLTGPEGRRARSSHNTFMSLLVEQGIVGAFFYILLLIWIAKTTFRLRRRQRESTGLVPNLYAATVAALGAITVGDIFVDYLKFEARFWFIALLMVIVKLDTLESERRDAEAEDSATKAA